MSAVVAKAFPDTLLDFQRMFPDEAACVAYLEELRWPGGFTYPSCKVVGEPQRIRTRLRVLRCRSCLEEDVSDLRDGHARDAALYGGKWAHHNR